MTYFLTQLEQLLTAQEDGDIQELLLQGRAVSDADTLNAEQFPEFELLTNWIWPDTPEFQNQDRPYLLGLIQTINNSAQ